MTIQEGKGEDMKCENHKDNRGYIIVSLNGKFLNVALKIDSIHDINL